MRVADPVLMGRQVEDFVIELCRSEAWGGLYVRVRIGKKLYYTEPVESERIGTLTVRAIRTGMSCYAEALQKSMMDGWKKGAG